MASELQGKADPNCKKCEGRGWYWHKYSDNPVNVNSKNCSCMEKYMYELNGKKAEKKSQNRYICLYCDNKFNYSKSLEYGLDDIFCDECYERMEAESDLEDELERREEEG